MDNTWLPMEPGTRSEFTGTVKDLTTSPPEVHTHRIVSIVTGLTKVIDGVRTVVLWDRDYSDGILQESELAFFAQTERGAVWLLGEYPEEFDAGKFAGAPSTFIAGVDKARAGIMMLAHPSKKFGPVTQASAPSIDFLDCGQVVSKKSGTLKIDEYNPLDGKCRRPPAEVLPRRSGDRQSHGLQRGKPGVPEPRLDHDAERGRTGRRQPACPGAGPPRLYGQPPRLRHHRKGPCRVPVTPCLNTC